MESNSTEEVPPTPIIEEHSEHADYHFIEIVIYPFYLTLLFVLCAAISLNKRKFAKRYRVHEIFLFCAVYLFNVLVTWNFFDFIPKFGRFVITLIIIFGVQHYIGRVQIIGITGGIACGKSTCCKFFVNYLQLKLIDCDQLARQIVEPGKPAYNLIVERFGTGVLQNQQAGMPIERKILGDIVFSNKVKRQILNSITNKYIFLAILKELWKLCFMQKEQYVVLDAPLLFESKVLAYLCYPIITVFIINKDEQIRRLCLRDEITEEQAKQRIDSQMPIEQKIKLSDISVKNDGSEKELVKQLQKVFEYLI